MSSTSLNQQLLESFKREAKKKKRADSSLSYNQWLDALSVQHGYATFSSLKRRVVELEQQAHKFAEEAQWAIRFKNPMVWQTLPDAEPG